MTHIYKCSLVRVIDGDTVKLNVDLGFRMSFTDSFRLLDVNTPELRGPDSDRALKAKEFVEKWFKDRENKDVFVQSEKHGKYRWLAHLYCRDDAFSLNVALIKNGLGEAI